MPLYTYKCPICDKEENTYRSVNDRHNGPMCHGQMQKVITGTMLAPVLGGGSIPGYQCPVTNQYITSRKQRRDIMAEHNLIEKG